MKKDCKLTTRKAAGLEVVEWSGEKEAPTALLFHGYGANGLDLAPLSGIDPKFNWIFPTGPIDVPYADKGWFPVSISTLQNGYRLKNADAVSQAFPAELSETRELGERLIAELNIPLSRLYIGGFSQGAVLATEIAFHLSEKLAGLIILSGTLINETRWKKLARNQAGMRFFQTHGKEDRILPHELAQQLEKLLVNAGLKGSLISFPGGHEIPPSILSPLHDFLITR